MATLRFILLLFLFSHALVWAGDGVVWTLDGKVYSGRVRLAKDQLVVIDPVGARVVRVGASNLLHVIMDSRVAGRDDDGLVGRRMGGGLPEGWDQRVLGGQPGSQMEVENGMFRLKAVGTALHGGEDRVHFGSKPVEGNHEIVARVLGVGRGEIAGIMMRGSLEPESASLMLGVRGEHGGMLRWRDRPAGELISKRLPGLEAPCWVRLKRVGDTFTAYVSGQGRKWRQVERLTIPMAGGFHVGLAGGACDPRMAGRVLEGGNRIDQVREGRSLPISPFVPQVRLRSGSVVAGRMQSDEGSILFPGPEIKPAIPVFEVASLNFQYLPQAMNRTVDLGRPGVLLLNGEFIDGRFQGISGGVVTISSVLFGLRQYDLNSEIRAVVLRQPVISAPNFEVRTSDGSHWLASRLEVGENEISIWEPLLGRVRIPIHEITEIRRIVDTS